ncbi:MAG: cadmium resistance transporter [Clostridia bacterium]|nr:cadmium resistance transporter [Clostridia bacterium]
MMEIVLLSVMAYVATNIDDMVINTFFFSAAQSRCELRGVVLGKYLGIGMLVLLSAAGACGLGFFPVRYVRYLGLIPIALGVRALVENMRAKGQECDEAPECGAAGGGGAGMLFRVAAVTIANGADNIGVYVPLFAGFSLSEYAVFCAVFAAMTALWCALGYRAAKLPALQAITGRYKKAIVPCVYILLGLYVLC